jgi:hypothetical protein
MSFLFDYGEFLLCILPIFLIMGAIYLALIWNNLPDWTVKKEIKDEQRDE